MYVNDPNDIPRHPDIPEVPILKTFEDVVRHFAPLTIDSSQGWDITPKGQHCWRVVGFHVTVGQTVLSPKVLDENGTYIPDKLVYSSYPGAPSQFEGAGKPNYSGGQGFSARTKHEGNGAHFVVIGSSNVAPDTAGPNMVWVAAEDGGPQYSDAVHGLGMRVNTNHLIVSPIFQDVLKDGDTQPPTNNDDEGISPPISGISLEEFLWSEGEPLIIPLNPSAMFYKVAQEQKLGERLTKEFDAEFKGQAYRVQLYELGMVYAPIPHWGQTKVFRRKT